MPGVFVHGAVGTARLPCHPDSEPGFIFLSDQAKLFMHCSGTEVEKVFLLLFSSFLLRPRVGSLGGSFFFVTATHRPTCGSCLIWSATWFIALQWTYAGSYERLQIGMFIAFSVARSLLTTYTPQRRNVWVGHL